MKKYFVKFLEDSPEFEALIVARPTAFALLGLIAYRARKAGLKIDDGIGVGEAYIGDFKSYGVTERVYRTDKQYLEKYKITTFKATSKGTIAKIVNPCVFDISRDYAPTDKATDKATDERRTSDGRATTNQEGKKEEGKSITGEKDSKYSLSPLTRADRIEIALEYHIPLEEVFKVERQVLNPENISKYKHRTTFHTTKKWLDRKIDKGELRQLDEIGYMALEGLYGGRQ